MGDYERLIVARAMIYTAISNLVNVTDETTTRDFCFDLNEIATLLEQRANGIKEAEKANSIPFRGVVT